MKKISVLLATVCLLGVVAFVSSCKKSTPKSKTELISRTWEAQKVESNGTTVYQDGASTQIENYSLYRLRFNNIAFDLTDSDNITFSGTWAFDATETNVNFTVPSNANFKPASVTIITLSETALTIRYTEVNSKGQSNELTLYLVPAG